MYVCNNYTTLVARVFDFCCAYAEADLNKDGKITCAEFKAYAKKHPELLHDLQRLRGIMHKIVRDDIGSEKKKADDDDLDKVCMGCGFVR